MFCYNLKLGIHLFNYPKYVHIIVNLCLVRSNSWWRFFIDEEKEEEEGVWFEWHERCIAGMSPVFDNIDISSSLFVCFTNG